MDAIVLAFATIHDALAAEKAARGIAGARGAELLPLPPSIKSDCGFGLFLATILGSEAELLAALRAAEVRYESAYSVREAAGIGLRATKEKSYERIDETP
jgi:hypothetical protein